MCKCGSILKIHVYRSEDRAGVVCEILIFYIDVDVTQKNGLLSTSGITTVVPLS